MALQAPSLETSSILRKTLATSKSEVHVLLEASKADRFDIRTSLELSKNKWQMIYKIFNEELVKNCPSPAERTAFWKNDSYQLPILLEPASSESLMKIYQGCFFRLGPVAIREGIEADKTAPYGQFNQTSITRLCSKIQREVPNIARTKDWQIDFRKSINPSELKPHYLGHESDLPSPLSTGASIDEQPYGF